MTVSSLDYTEQGGIQVNFHQPPPAVGPGFYFGAAVATPVSVAIWAGLIALFHLF